jgi:translocator protein
MPDLLKLIASILICQSAGLLGSLFSVPAVRDWYDTLKKPSFTPPSWLFGPAWITLYTLMGISAFLIWRQGLAHRDVQTALIIFLVQLILNALWSMLFFGLHSPLAGLVEIVVLWITIVLTIILFAGISMAAALLLIPYFLWTTFAAALNAAFYNLNR